MAFDSYAPVDDLRSIDLKSAPGGIYGAFTDGALRVLTAHVDFHTLAGRSAGTMMNLCHVTAQHQAQRGVTNPHAHQARRNSTVQRFGRLADNFWYGACAMAAWPETIASARALLAPLSDAVPPLVQPWAQMIQTLAASTHDTVIQHSWLTATAQLAGNARYHPLASIVRANIPGVEDALTDPAVAAVIADSVNYQTGARRITASQDAAGTLTGARLEDYVASACLPLLFPAMDGIWIDGEVQAERNMLKGTVIEHSRRPLLAIDLGETPFAAYAKSFRGIEPLFARAVEAMAAPSAPLPSDRPTAILRFPHVRPVAAAELPTRARVRDLQQLGMATATAALPTILHDLELAPARSTTVFGVRMAETASFA